MMAQLEAPQTPQVPLQAKPAEFVMDPPQEYSHLADVPLRVEALLDRINMNMRAVASFQVGSVLTLRRSAGDNVDLWVGGVKLASGEIVVIENTIGVRITDLLTGE
jgi:flagellar motor switch protein FliN/FliY